ncbi:tyrosine-type recombinase/integrase [Lipingzhangella sp. LS1_29]|uniref:Tyrosine-type recombinase/integrase n=1 Tax=Lipingzhangella rawalii TaxID=2055835 RepID=A0ABU2H3W4_9ACTN|nr:tyrosine-type recombinase/integrase [Lipingzhangella rawalii]MDS1269999.1 tyrosine-type recombinase/integrase [Lipingzhangella rawalii]
MASPTARPVVLDRATALAAHGHGHTIPCHRTPTTTRNSLPHQPPAPGHLPPTQHTRGTPNGGTVQDRTPAHSPPHPHDGAERHHRDRWGDLLEQLPKTDERRTVPIPASLVPELKPLVDRRGDDAHVFTTKRGAPLRNARRGQWEPIKAGLTPHGLRHSHKTWMIEDGIPEILQHERLGHELGGIGAVYSHITERMRQQLRDALTARWEQALEERAALAPGSAVRVLERLLGDLDKKNSRKTEEKAVTRLRSRRQVTA